MTIAEVMSNVHFAHLLLQVEFFLFVFFFANSKNEEVLFLVLFNCLIVQLIDNNILKNIYGKLD